MGKKIDHLILKVLVGEASSLEQMLLDTWLSEKEENRDEFRLIENAWKSQIRYPNLANSEEEFEKLWQRANPQENKENNTSVQFNWFAFLKIAAVLLIFLSVAFYFYNKGRIVDAQLPVHEVATITKSTTQGHKSRIFLKDGSQIWLNAASSVEYPDTYEYSDVRTLTLKGEAYFQVARNERKPFRIKCGEVLVEVLGTAFNVNASHIDRIDIALSEGSVKVQWSNVNGQSEAKILKTGEMLSINLRNHQADVSSFDLKAVTGWKDGLLYFDDASFTEVLDRLSNWYGVKFQVKGSPNEPWAYKGEFDNYVLENVLYAMSFSEEFRFEIQGDTILIMFN